MLSEAVIDCDWQFHTKFACDSDDNEQVVSNLAHCNIWYFAHHCWWPLIAEVSPADERQNWDRAIQQSFSYVERIIKQFHLAWLMTFPQQYRVTQKANNFLMFNFFIFFLINK